MSKNKTKNPAGLIVGDMIYHQSTIEPEKIIRSVILKIITKIVIVTDQDGTEETKREIVFLVWGPDRQIRIPSTTVIRDLAKMAVVDETQAIGTEPIQTDLLEVLQELKTMRSIK